MGPFDTPAYRARTLAAVLGIECRLLRVWFVPVVPTLRADVVSELAVDEDSLGKGSPRTSEVNFPGILIMNQTAVFEDIAEFFVLRC